MTLVKYGNAVYLPVHIVSRNAMSMLRITAFSTLPCNRVIHSKNNNINISLKLNIK